MQVTATQLPAVEDVIPHSGPMVLLDRLTKHQEDRLFAEVVLREDSMFVRDGRVRGIVTVEYMAQAVAAFVGIRDRFLGDPIEIGYLIGIREMKITQPYLSVGDVLEVEAHHVWGDSKLGSFKTAVRRDRQPVAQATLTVYRGDIPEEAS